MKRIILISVLLCGLLFDISAQRVIQSNSNSCKIWSTIPDLSGSRLNYIIQFDAVDLDSVKKYIPIINNYNIIVVSPTVFKYEGYITVANAWDIVKAAEIEKSDVGQHGDEFLQRFCTAILYMANPLQLDLSQWTLNE